MRFSDAINNGSPPSGDWRNLLYFAGITAITVAAEYFRRIMPPPRRRRTDKEDDDA